MKIFSKAFIVAFSLLSIITIQGDALEKAPPNVELEGNANGIVYIPGDEPFLLGEEMVPGDKITRTLEIKNKYDKSYKLYLKAERVTPRETYDLLDVINLKITHKDEVIYEGAVSGEDGMIEHIDLGTYNPGDEHIYLGTYNPGDEENLIATVEFDPSISPADANYWNKKAQVDWIFTAQATEDTSKPITPPSGNKPFEDIGSTQTGDTNILPYVILGGVSVLGIYKFSFKRGE